MCQVILTEKPKLIKSSDERILAIPIRECHEDWIDVKTQDTIAFGPAPECIETEPDYTKLRKTIYDKLCLAQDELPLNWRFRLYEGFRSLEVQQFLFDQEYRRVKTNNPNFNHEQLFMETTRLVSPVTNLDGSINVPPHNTGAAIDIEIITAEGHLVDMGMAIADWSLVAAEVCLTHCNHISTAAQKNRGVLLAVMEKHDFVNYPYEWWHFSYGDRAWAYYKKKSHAIYGVYNAHT